MKAIQISVLAGLAGLAVAIPSRASRGPTKTINRRSVTGCSAFASNTESPYVIQNNLWGAGAGTGSQCYTANPVNGDTISWSTEWTWANNPENVKSYANVLLEVSDLQLSQISSIPTTWDWSYAFSNPDTVADVSYDMFTATTPTASSGDHSYEFMVWLASYGGANPISDSYGNGFANPIAQPVIGNVEFNLTRGQNGGTTVYSFLPANRATDLTSFSGDINVFIQYLTEHEGVPTNQYLLSVQAGTEAFSGSGTLTTSYYSLAVNP